MSTSYKIFNYRKFDIEKLKYSSPQKSRNNVFICPVDSNVDMLFQTSIVKLARDAIVTDKMGALALQVDKTNDFYDFFKKMDEHNIKCIFDNCKEWFNDQLDYPTIKEFYKSNIHGENELVLPLPVKKGEVQVKIYDQHKNELDYTKLTAGSSVVLCFRHNGIKFLKKQSIADLDICQIQLFVEDEPKPVPKVVHVVADVISSNTDKNSEIVKRMQAKNKITEMQTKLTEAVSAADKAQLHANELKEYASELAKQLKTMEDDYENDDEDEEEDE
jgi:hypothetical protein